jgi:CheY-like chemotaxis protein
MARDPRTSGGAATGGGAGARSTAVVIDADPDVRALVRTALEGRRVEVVADASSGAEAVELARQWRPTVLVLEHPLADVHLLDVVPHVRRASPATCIVLFAARAIDVDAEPAALRPNHVVAKLGGVAGLVAAIDDCLEATSP